MRIIIDGPDGAGKTTLVKKLADHFGCDILVLTENGSKNFTDYLHKAGLNNIVSDRSFLSEIVYADVFERPSELTPAHQEALLQFYRANMWQIIILNASVSCLHERLNLRGDEDLSKIVNLEKLRQAYKYLSTNYGLPMLDSETLDFEKLVKDLEDMKYVSHHG